MLSVSSCQQNYHHISHGTVRLAAARGNTTVFWDLQTFIRDSLRTSVKSALHSPLWSEIYLALSWTPSGTNWGLLYCSYLEKSWPRAPFVVKVNASTIGIGVVLLRWQDKSSKLHSCAFYSKKLSPVEQNYDIGNHELLAIKLTLEKWRHSLEGASHLR